MQESQARALLETITIMKVVIASICFLLYGQFLSKAHWVVCTKEK